MYALPYPESPDFLKSCNFYCKIHKLFNMPDQVLTIEPQNELKFKGLFERGCTSYIRLTNPTTDTVLFKIKTTAPKKYCVRPNSGVLEPNSKIEIAITPQPVYVDANEKHKHKFMVQSVIAPEGNINIDQVWKEMKPNQLMDYKLKCVFETPHGTNIDDASDCTAQNDTNRRGFEIVEDTKTTRTLSYKSDNDSDIQKAISEVLLLRNEESKLRNENLQLKEELLRLRQEVVEGKVTRRHSYEPGRVSPASMFSWAACTLFIIVMGIVVGKFLM